MPATKLTQRTLDAMYAEVRDYVTGRRRTIDPHTAEAVCGTAINAMLAAGDDLVGTDGDALAVIAGVVLERVLAEVRAAGLVR